MLRISFDLDDTLICYQDGVACEPNRVPRLLRPWYREPIRAGAPALMRELSAQGWDVWVYTTSNRPPGPLRVWFGFYGVRLGGVVNQDIYDRWAARNGGRSGKPSKYPPGWNIRLHVDDSDGVEWEGRRHGFSVVVVSPDDPDWADRVREAAARYADIQPRSPG